MSVIAMAAVFKAQGLSPTHKLVLLSLADHANDEGRHIYPSIPKTASKTGLSDRSVQRAIKDLVELDLLAVIKEGGGRAATEYRLNMSKLNELIPPEPEPKKPKGCQTDTAAVTDCHPRGDTVTPLTIIEPSVKHKDKADIPESLSTPDFLAAWEEWKDYRKEAGKKITPTTARRQLDTLAAAGPAAAVAMIGQSIEHGWQGLFPLKNQPNNNTNNGKPTPAPLKVTPGQEKQGGWHGQ